MAINLVTPDEFGREVLAQYEREGWGSLSKRDLELLIFILLEKDGALPRTLSNYNVARELRVTETKVAALRRDAYARWRPLTGEDSRTVLRRVLPPALNKDRLEMAIKFSGRKMNEGFIPILIEHPDDRAELEHAVKEANGIPVYERNREVLLVHYITLLEIAEKLDILESDPVKIQAELGKLLGTQANLADFLKKPVKKLTLSGARSALNDAGVIVVEGALRNLLPALLKTAIPSIP